MHQILFKLGGFPIYTYGFFVFLGVLAAYFIASREASRLGINQAKFGDIFFWSLVAAFGGARLVYLLVEFKTFRQYPLDILLARSGFVFYGGVIFSLTAAYLLTKKFKLNFRQVGDAAGWAAPLGHALGRLGCFFQGCCYGRASDSFCGLLFPPDSPAGLQGIKVIPAQLVSAVSLFLIFIALTLLKKKKAFEGQILLYYLILYGLFRFTIEFFRGDARGRILFLSTSQVMALGLVGLAVFLWRRWRARGLIDTQNSV